MFLRKNNKGKNMLKNVDCSKNYIHLGDLGYGLKLIDIDWKNEMPYVEAMENHVDTDKIGKFGDLGKFVNDYTWHRDMKYGDHKYEIVVVLDPDSLTRSTISSQSHTMRLYGKNIGDRELLVRNLSVLPQTGHWLLLERSTDPYIYNFIHNITLAKMKYDLSKGRGL